MTINTYTDKPETQYDEKPPRSLLSTLTGLVMRRLPNDVCRCHDHKCQKSNKCLRFLQRDTGYECSVHTQTLRLQGTHQCGCDEFIDA